MLLAFGCQDPIVDVPDSGAAFEDAATEEDAAQTDALPNDAAVIARDAAPIDGSLAGTSLDGIALEWAEDLLLCDAWLDADDLDRAADQKVQVSLPVHARSSLDPAALASANLERGFVHHSPFSADQGNIDGSSSTLIEWTLTGPPESAHLAATVAHDLGAAGTLFETLSVQRASTDRTPVSYDGTEVAFAHQPLDGERTALVPCGGGKDGETVVVVLSAFAGGDWLTLLREQNVSSSGAIYPSRAEVLLSSHPAYGGAVPAGGFFTQLSAGSLSRVRFDRALEWNYLVFGPLARSEMPTYPPSMPKQIELDGTLSLTSVSLPDGTESTQSYDVEVGWIRVDEGELSRELVSCATPEIVTVWGPSADRTHLFQLGFCQPNSPIGELALFVPVDFELDPHLAGARFDAGTISQVDVAGFPGVEIDLGSYRVRIAEPGAVRIQIADELGNLIEETNGYRTELFQTGQFSGTTELLSGKSDDSSVGATLERQWVAQGAGNSGIYAPVSFELVLQGTTRRVVAWDKLVYTNSHHNWDDTLETDDGELRMSWRVLEFGQAYEVGAVSISDGSVVLAPTVIR
jgi:hypothetical protein